MDPIIRGLCIYIFLLLIFKIAGKRTLAQQTNFDLILLLIISETTQQALIDDDHSMTNAFLLIITLVGISIGLSHLKQNFPKLEKWLEGAPLILIRNGKVDKEHLDKERVDEHDIMACARALRGLESEKEIKYAVLERNGEITIISKADSKEREEFV